MVIDLLSAFLRSTAPVPDGAERRDWQARRGALPPPDIAAAASVIGRRNTEEEPRSDTPCRALGGPSSPCLGTLVAVDLSSMTLTEADFDRFDLRGTSFSATNLAFAQLRGADLSGADLRGTNLRLADLTGARLQGAHLEQTNLHLVVGLSCEQLHSTGDGGAGAANLALECDAP